MKKIKVLNLYAGIGGNRKLWKNVDVTAVENNPKIANIYKENFPEDEVIVGDAHKYLEEHYDEFDFIWSSPPCPTHSKVRFANQKQNKPIYPSMILYEEIIFLKHYFKGKFVVENVIAYYEPLIKPQEISQHYYWTNFPIPKIKKEFRGMGKNENLNDLYKLKGFDLSKYNGIDKMKTIRNCVEPKAGLHIFNSAYQKVQKTLSNLSPTSQTKSSKEDFPNGEHNISLKDNSNELSQISSNDETSLNNNIQSKEKEK